MTKPLFEIGADGIDTEQIVREIQETVARKAKEGVYDDARIARAERSNLVNLKNSEEFLSFYLRNLRQAAFVDISDFEIRERRSLFAPILVRLKKGIWKLQKFYTYRLWSQQNQVNGLLVTAIQGLDEKYSTRIKELEEEVARLKEGDSIASSTPPRDAQADTHLA